MDIVFFTIFVVLGLALITIGVAGKKPSAIFFGAIILLVVGTASSQGVDIRNGSTIVNAGNTTTVTYDFVTNSEWYIDVLSFLTFLFGLVGFGLMISTAEGRDNS